MSLEITALLVQAEYVLRIIIAAACGLCIGLERRGRMRSAGPRTHLLVALSCALMMIVSKYGFFDVLGRQGIGLDPSRVAAGIITGITFMGAGLIFVHKREVNGVSTAAGLWATVGVGMAIGAGMYFLGISVCIIVILLQMLLHSPLRIFREAWVAQVEIVLNAQACNVADFCAAMQSNDVEVLGSKVKHNKDGTIEIKMDGLFAPHYTKETAVSMLESIDGIISVIF